jgi:Do/DeqQ family serine protease
MHILIRFHQSCKIISLTLLMGMIFLSFSPPAFPAAAKETPIDFSTAIVQVAKKNTPAVVHIEVTERQEVANPFLPFGNDPFFRRFFDIPQMPKKFKREIQGLGSGMIIDAQGNILTTHHVAGGATKIDVQLANGERYPAKLVGTDPKTDLAVIKIDAKRPLPHVTFGDSDKAEVGEWVVAIGAPRGLDLSVTQGIISAKHRRGIADPGSYQDFLQTDAAINPGNSGGPLLNLQGQVVGVNAVIISQSGGFEGIGFTIPSNIAVHVAEALIAHGKVERGWLGVDIRDLTPELAKTVRAEGVSGVLVADVVKGGPAEKAGMKKNDVIVGFAGKAISDVSMLRNQAADAPVGREVKVAVLRNGQRTELSIRIGNLESASKVLAAAVGEHLGVEVRAVTDRERQKYTMTDAQGVVITRVEARSAMGEAGFEVGDIILGIENQAIAGLDDFIALAGTLQPKQKITVVALDHRTGNVGSAEVTVK